MTATLTPIDSADIRTTLKTVTLVWFVFSLLAVYSHWPDVSSLDLTDNDDYMRYVQFMTWIEYGGWYIKPLQQLNPEEGNLIHWSRVPDLLLAGTTLLFSQAFSLKLASLISITLVPLIYLWILLTSLAFITHRLAGNEAVFLALCFFLLSPAVHKFYPGSIDHHNIQIVLTTLFTLLMPLRVHQAKKSKVATLQGFILALSLWISLESLILFVILMVILVLAGYFNSLRFLYYVRIICISCVFFTSLFLLFHHPVEHLAVPYVETLSWLHLFCLIVATLFCELSIRTSGYGYRWIRFLVIGAAALVLIALVTPQIIMSPYSGYPEILNRYWLSLISEVISILGYIERDGFFDLSNRLLFIIPALCSIAFIYKSKVLSTYYLMFLALLAVPFFWQARASVFVYPLSIPLQVICALMIMSKVRYTLAKAMVCILCAPMVSALLVSLVSSGTTREDLQSTNSFNKLEIIKTLEKSSVNGMKLLTPVDYGPIIIAKTDNSVISAPYYRNINGNTLMIEMFTETRLEKAHRLIKNNKIDYLVLGGDPSTKALARISDSDSLANRLERNETPDWLEKVDESENGVKLYKVLTK